MSRKRDINQLLAARGLSGNDEARDILNFCSARDLKQLRAERPTRRVALDALADLEDLQREQMLEALKCEKRKKMEEFRRAQAEMRQRRKTEPFSLLVAAMNRMAQRDPEYAVR